LSYPIEVQYFPTGTTVPDYLYNTKEKPFLILVDVNLPIINGFTHYRNDPKNPASLGNDTVIVIMKDSEGTMWVGDYMGLERFDSKTGRFIHFAPKKNDTTSLSNNEVRTIYDDKQGTLWVGTGSPWFEQPAEAACRLILSQEYFN
jgi:ligand-binding sensor domain-containing protein